VIIGSPRGDHNDIGFDFASVVEECTRFVEPLKFRSALDLDLTIDDHGAGSEIWEGGRKLWFQQSSQMWIFFSPMQNPPARTHVFQVIPAPSIPNDVLKPLASNPARRSLGRDGQVSCKFGPTR
jgi:hypothetical protein